MKRKRLSLALVASLAFAVLSVGTAAATGLFSSHHDSTRRDRRGAQRPPSRQRDLLPRRRDGDAGDHRRPLLPGRRGRAQRRPHALHRLQTRPGRSSRAPGLITYPTSTPTRRRPARCGRPARRRSTSASRRARASPRTFPARTSKTVLEVAQKQGMKVGSVSTAEITDATPAVLAAAHVAARLPGPGQHGGLPDGDQGGRRPRLDRRAGGRPRGGRAARRWALALRAENHRWPRCRQNGGRVGAGARATPT